MIISIKSEWGEKAEFSLFEGKYRIKLFSQKKGLVDFISKDMSDVVDYMVSIFVGPIDYFEINGNKNKCPRSQLGTHLQKLIS